MLLKGGLQRLQAGRRSGCIKRVVRKAQLLRIDPAAGQAAEAPARVVKEQRDYDTDRGGRQVSAERPPRPPSESSGRITDRARAAVQLLAGRTLQLLPPLLPLLLLRRLLSLQGTRRRHTTVLLTGYNGRFFNEVHLMHASKSGTLMRDVCGRYDSWCKEYPS